MSSGTAKAWGKSAGVLVRDNDGPRVELEGAEGGEVADALLDGLAEGEALALAGDDDLADGEHGGDHGGDADGEGHAGNLGERELARMVSYASVLMRVREARDEPAGGGQCHARGERRGVGLTGLVEGEVAVLADACEEEVDAAGVLDALLVGGALADEVWDGVVEDVDLRGRDVDVREELGEPARAHASAAYRHGSGRSRLEGWPRMRRKRPGDSGLLRT